MVYQFLPYLAMWEHLRWLSSGSEPVSMGPCHHSNIQSHYNNLFDYYFREDCLLHAAACLEDRNMGEKATVLTGGWWLSDECDTHLMQVSWQLLLEKFQPVKYYLSRTSTSRKIKLKNCKLSFLVFSFNFILNFSFKTYGTLKRFQLSTYTNFCILLSSCAEQPVEKNSSLNFMSLVGFQVSKICMSFWKIYCVVRVKIIFWQIYFF